MNERRSRIRVEVDRFNTSDEVTARRAYESLQIDGLQPSRSRVASFLRRFKINLRPDGQRTPRNPRKD